MTKIENALITEQVSCNWSVIIRKKTGGNAMYDNEFMEQLLQGISVQEERRHPGKTEKCLPGSKNEAELAEMLKISNAAAALVTTKKGALKSMPEKEEINYLIH